MGSDPFAGHDIDDGVGVFGLGAALELGGVPAPELVRAPLAPVGPRGFGPGRRAGLSFEDETMTCQNAVHRGRRHPHPILVGASVGEFAVRPVDVAPLFEQSQDLVLFPLQEPVHRIPAGDAVFEAAGGPALLPAPQPAPVDLHHRAHPPQRPAGIDRDVDEPQQHGFGGPVDTGGDRAAHPQRDFPRSTASSTACSTTVAWNRSTSARNTATSDTSAGGLRAQPGLDDRNAAKAPSRATARNRETTDRPTPASAAACARVIRPESIPTHKSYSCSAVRTLLGLRCTELTADSPQNQSQQPSHMRSEKTGNLSREVRHNTPPVRLGNEVYVL